MADARHEFHNSVMFMQSPQTARLKATEIFLDPDLDNRADFILAGSAANPFFVPYLPDDLDPAALMSVYDFQRAIALGRASAANTRTQRILFSSAPKTGSTFVSTMLGRVLDLRKTTLTVNSTTPGAQSWFGGATDEHCLHESAVLVNCLAPTGFIAHNHMACSPLTANILGMYNIRPIVTERNIFDTLVSFDDHLMRQMPKSNEHPMLRHGVPSDYMRRSFEERIAILVDLKLGWYVRYYTSWQLCERQELARPLTINYERDILGSKQALAEKLKTFLGLDASTVPALSAALSENGGEALNVNKGVAGRGAAITGKNRDAILAMFARYRDEADFSAILGE